MKIAILGAGAGGCAAAGTLTQKGYDVALWNRSAEKIKPIIEKGGIEFFGYIDGFVKIKTVTQDIREAIRGAELISLPIPGYGQKEMAELCAPFLEDKQVILLNPGSAGSIEFANVLKRRQVKKDITIVESITLALGGGRTQEPGKVRIGRPFSISRTAAFPGKKTDESIDYLKNIFEGLYTPKPAKNVLEVGLLNVNFVVHPVPTILNIGYAELDKLFNTYHDGISPSVLRCMEQLDIEKQNLLKALNIEPISCDDIYKKEFGIPHGIPQRRKPPNEGWSKKEEKKRGRGWEYRYLMEDVQYGLVLISSLGDQFNVPTPITDAMVELGSIITETDFWETGRTAEKLGISKFSLDQLEYFLYEGQMSNI